MFSFVCLFLESLFGRVAWLLVLCHVEEVEECAGGGVGKGIVVVEGDAVFTASHVEGAVEFVSGVFPDDVEVVGDGVEVHGVVEYGSVESCIMGDDCFSLETAFDFGVYLHEVWGVKRLLGGDVVYVYELWIYFVLGRFDDRVIFFDDVSVDDGDDGYGASGEPLHGGGFEVDCDEVEWVVIHRFNFMLR